MTTPRTSVRKVTASRQGRSVTRYQAYVGGRVLRDALGRTRIFWEREDAQAALDALV